MEGTLLILRLPSHTIVDTPEMDQTQAPVIHWENGISRHQHAT